MDSQVASLIRRLQAPKILGGYDAIESSLSRLRERWRLVPDRETAADLAELLAEWAERARERDASRAWLDAARLWVEETGQHGYAAAMLGRALARSPQDAALCESLVVLFSRAQAYAELELVLHRHAEALESAELDAERRARSWKRLARLRHEQLGDVAGAIEAYEKALDAEPDLTCVQLLAELYQARGSAGDRDQAADLLCAMADFAGPKDAAVHLRQALDLNPRHGEALEALAALAPAVATVEEVARRRRASSGAPPPQVRTSAPPPLPAKAVTSEQPARSLRAAPMAASISPRPTRFRHVTAWLGVAAAAAAAVWLAAGGRGHGALVEASQLFSPPTPQLSDAPQPIPAPISSSAAAQAPAPADEEAIRPSAAAPPVGAEAAAEIASGTESTPPGTVSIGERLTHTRGGRIARAELLQALEGFRTKAEECYVEALERRPGLRGRMTLAWTISRAGDASRVGRRGDTLRDDPARRCVATALRDTPFPKPARRVARARTALVFQPN